MSDYIKRADAIEALSRSSVYAWSTEQDLVAHSWAIRILQSLPSVYAEPKWNCTANFVAEQLDRLRNMTDEERWDFFIKFFSPSADAVSREEYEETDGVVAIEKKNANEVGEIKHIVIRSPNYTRYFYNESMPLPSADAVHGEWIWRTDIPIGDGRTSAGYICSNCGKDYWHGNVFNYCPSCGTRMENTK